MTGSHPTSPKSPASVASRGSDGYPSNTEEKEPADGRLTFRANLAGGFGTAQKKLATSWRVSESYLTMLKDRASLEEMYATGLDRIASKAVIDSSMIGSSLSEAMNSHKQLLATRAEQCRVLSASMREDVIPALEETMKEQAHVQKRTEERGAHIQKQYEKSHLALDKAFAKYGKICRDADAGAVKCIYNDSMKPSTRSKLATKVAQLCQEATAAEGTYTQAVSAAKKTVEEHKASMTKILDTFQDLELRRSECLRDAMRKMAVHHISWIRNVQYDYDSPVGSFENASPQKDLNDFISQHSSEGETVGPPEVSKLHWWQAGLLELGQSRRTEANPPDAADLTWKPSPEAEDEINAVLDKVWSASLEDGDPFTRTLQDPANRALFCRCLEQRLAVQVELSRESFAILAKLVMAALDWCDRDFDVWNARFIMWLSQVCYAIRKDNGKQVFLQARLHSHKLWNRVEFWEACVCMTIAEEMMCTALRRRPGVDADFKSSLNAGLLDSLGTCMVKYGIAREQASELFARVCEENGHFGDLKVIRRLKRAFDASHERTRESFESTLGACTPPVPRSTPRESMASPSCEKRAMCM